MVRGSISVARSPPPGTLQHGIMQMSTSGGDPVRIPTASGAMFPLNVSQEGDELLVKDNHATGNSGASFETTHPREAHPRQLGADLLGRTWLGRPMERCWLTRMEATCCWPRATDRIPKASFAARLALFDMVTRGEQTEVSAAIDPKTNAQSLWEGAVQGRICIRCSPDGIIPQTNAAGNGRRTGDTSGLPIRRADLGPLRNKEGFFTSPLESPSS